MRERTTRPLPQVVSTLSNSREPERQRRGMTGQRAPQRSKPGAPTARHDRGNVLRKSRSAESQRRGMTGQRAPQKSSPERQRREI